ncbi:hypothetical protein BC829DRAFT_102384 [Chytridium lagenaria]|nr:hypothetical protein BC829DRAFT_102384 [Chytridium lagenaria]
MMKRGNGNNEKTVLSVLLRTLSYPWNPSRSDRVQDLFLPFKTAKMLRHVISRAGKGHFNDVENWKQVGSRIGDTFKPSILPSLWEISDLMFSSLGQRQGKSIKFLSLPITITYAIRRLGTATSHSHAGNATSLEKGETTRRNRLLRIVTNEQQQIDLLRKRVKAWNDALEEVWDLMEDAHLVVFGGPSAAATETLNKARLDRRGGGGGRATEMEKEKCTLRRLVRPKLEFRAVDFETLSMDEQVAVAQGRMCLWDRMERLLCI